MNYSENYGFALPDDGDFYDIAPISENFDAIDTILAEGESKMEEISNKIGTPAENGQTLFSLLSSGGGSIIRSIQHLIQEVTGTSIETDIAITPVNTDKTLVLVERLEENTNSGVGKIAYTLTTDNFHLSLGNYHGTVGFWIIEFA